MLICNGKECIAGRSFALYIAKDTKVQGMLEYERLDLKIKWWAKMRRLGVKITANS